MRRERGWVAVETIAWTLAVAGVAVAARSPGVSGASPSVMQTAVAPTGPLLDGAAGDSLTRAAERIAAADPFRVSHTPPTVTYAPGAMPTIGYQPPPPPPKPRLALRGVFGERARLHAILVGVPGRDAGAIVQRGDTLAGLRVVRIGADTVVVAGLDTVWTLTVRAEWQP